MSTQGIRDFRPNIHFTPPKMWNNDPNGLFYAKGTYHLYYQYYPEAPVWGPMHWGHATSKDLIHWEHHPIALYPDELGYIFSGSAVYDEKNTSGFGTLENPPVVAMFTHHLNVKKEDGTETAIQQQSIAYSLDGGYTFTKYKGNPVIPTPGFPDFRDPKIFWNEQRNCWGMVVSATDRAYFYASPDLKNWEKTGEFGGKDNYANGMWECPDLFPLDTPDGKKWVLLVSMGRGAEEAGPRIQYFIGQFDGDTFHWEDLGKDEYFNCGRDDYAGVTYWGTKKRTYIGWGVNPSYADRTPTGEFCGIMTLPKEVSLVKTPQKGYRPAFTPIQYQQYLGKERLLSQTDRISSETFALTVQGTGKASVTLENKEGQKLIFGVTQDNKIFVDRSNAGAKDFSENYTLPIMEYQEAERYYDGSYQLTAVFDVSVLELFADENTRYFTDVVYPDSPYSQITVEGDITVSYADIEY